MKKRNFSFFLLLLKKTIGSVLFLLLITPVTGFSQTQTITYTASTEDFLNPDRGFYYPSKTEASSFESLTVDGLLSLKNVSFTPTDANYMVRVNLLQRSYELDAFVGTDNISPTFLNALQAG